MATLWEFKPAAGLFARVVKLGRNYQVEVCAGGPPVVNVLALGRKELCDLSTALAIEVLTTEPKK